MRRITFNLALVTLGLVVATIFQPLSYLESFASPGQQGNCQTFKETGKTVCGRFLQYWQQNGGLPQQGFPISGEFREKSDLDGKEYTVQYFERAVFEMHPENKPPYDVLLSQLGTFWARSKYGNPPKFPNEGVPQPTAVATPPTGVGAQAILKPGIIVTLTERVSTCYGNEIGVRDGTMSWTFTIKNTTNSPFTLVLDKDSVKQVDNVGKSYALRELGCGELATPKTLKPGDTAVGWMIFDVRQITPSTTYFDLLIGNLSGASVTFRYLLR